MFENVSPKARCELVIKVKLKAHKPFIPYLSVPTMIFNI